jgi:hypothetical protein
LQSMFVSVRTNLGQLRAMRSTSVARSGCAAGPLSRSMPATPALSDVHPAGVIRSPALNDRLAWSPPEPCPICGVAMLGSRTNASHQEFDRFAGFNCGLVMNYSKMS